MTIDVTDTGPTPAIDATDDGNGSEPPFGRAAPSDPPRAPRTGSYMFYRVLGIVGRVLISAGVILLLFVAYQLWGTGIHTARAQDRLDTEFSQTLAELQEAAGLKATGAIEIGEGDPEQPPGELFDFAPEDIPAPEDGAAIGLITIPRIGLEYSLVQGVELTYLRDGPGHFPTTRYPGQEGNAGLAGHRTTYGQPFHNIDQLSPGDPISVMTAQGIFTYEVMSAAEASEKMPFEVGPDDGENGHFIISPDDFWILDDYNDNRLTLMACHPKYSARQRIVVVAELVTPAAETPEALPVVEDPDTGETLIETDLLGSDASARLPAILWALAAGAIWFTAWVIGRRWRRWPAYAVGTPIFLLVLFGCFVQVERLLPAAF